MRIVLTGSLGPISRPMAVMLIAQGHHVTVVSREGNKRLEIEGLGAQAAIGSIEDIDFLSDTFTGADAVYLMEPTVNIFDPTIDLLRHYQHICVRYVHAVLNANVKKIVHLSSIGGHSDTGNGMLAFHYYAEQALKALPESVAITTLRPTPFYSNILAFLPTIKAHNAIITSYFASEPEPWASPLDIAEAAAQELNLISLGRKVRYIISDEVTSTKLTEVLGQAIGKQIQWITVSHTALEKTLLEYGMSPQAANGFVRLNEAKQSGTLYEDINPRKAGITYGKVKIADFAREFANVYHSA